MHVGFGIGRRQRGFIGQRADQVGVAAMVILRARQQVAGVGIAARANHVMHRSAEIILAIPVQRIVGDGRHRAQMREGGPHALAGGDMRAMQRAGLAGVEAFRQVMRVPQVQIAHLRAIDAGDAKEMPGGHVKGACVAGWHQRFAGLLQRRPGGGVERHVRLRQCVGRIADHRRDGAAGGGVGGLLHGLSLLFATGLRSFRVCARPRPTTLG